MLNPRDRILVYAKMKSNALEDKDLAKIIKVKTSLLIRVLDYDANNPMIERRLLRWLGRKG